MSLGRTTKSLRLLAALSLVAGALSAVPNGAGAAASEVERDRLSGSTRFKTAVEIAEAFVEEVESDRLADDIDTVILVSGHDDHFAYAIPAPALARQHRAPILLTEPDELHADAHDFIEDFDIANVIILGGTDIVSEDVEGELEEIGDIDIDRIAGDDEYETAVEIADEVGTPGDLGRLGRTLFLATGEAFADALAVGPVAYVGEHPILLTPRDSIPRDVLDFIDGSRAEHVVILGGTGAVSSGIEDDVEDLGMDVTRWAGASRIETAVEMAKALLDDEEPLHECFDGSEVGLAFAWNHPDAIVSGPYLGELCAPLLLTERRALSDEVTKMLESVEYFTGGETGELRITAFGGTSVISNSVLRDAADAAELEALDATVTAVQGGCHFDVMFSEPVSSLDATNPDNYTYIKQGETFDFGVAYVDDLENDNDDTTTASVRAVIGGPSPTGGAIVPTGCGDALGPNDTVGVVANRIYATDNIRTVRPTRALVQRDARRPTITITAVTVIPIVASAPSTATASDGALHATPGQATAVLIEADEPIMAKTGTSIAITFTGERDTDTTNPLDSGTLTKSVEAGSLRIEVTCSELETLSGSLNFNRAAVTSFGGDTEQDTQSCLAIGDTVTIETDQLTDLAGNEPGRIRTVTVAKDDRAPRAAVSITAPVSNQNASVYLEGQDAGRVFQANALQIMAKSGSAVDGAAGNGWVVEMVLQRRRPSDWSPTQSAAADVSRSKRTISITATDDSTLEAIARDINGDPDFASLFAAEVTPGDEELNAAEPIRSLILDGGSSAVNITVSWSETIRDCDYAPDPATALSGDPLAALTAFQRTRVDHDGIQIDIAGDGLKTFDLLDGLEESTLGISVTAGCDTSSPGVRSGTIVATVESTDFDALPTSRSRANIARATAYDLSGNPNERQLLVRMTLAR